MFSFMMKPLHITLALLITALVNVAHADVDSKSKVYVGFKTGAWTFTGGNVGDYNSSSFGVFGGYKFNPYLALEIDYLFNTRATTGNSTETRSSESNSYILSLRPILPLNEHWELFGKVGWEYYHYTQTITKLDGRSEDVEGDENVFATGLGVAWNKNPFHFRAEVQASQSLTSNAADFWVYSVGIAYLF